jgi:hypothetical protein
VPDGTKVTPGQTAVSKPDKDGIVTMLRPIVTRLHADDPLRIALHWETEKGPLLDRGENRTYNRADTLRSMIFTLTTADGKKHEFKAEVPADMAVTRALYYSPTFVFTLSKDVLLPDAHYGGGAGKHTWAGGTKLDLSKPGAYKLRIKGSLAGGKPETPFETGEIAFEVGVRTIKSQEEIEKTARAALAKNVSNLPLKMQTFLHDDKEGNRLVRLRAPNIKWSYTEYVIAVQPDGTVGKIREHTVGTCIASGTLVDAEKGLRAIETLREGDRVWGYDGTKRVLTTIRLVRKGLAERTLVFGGLRVTADHPLWANGVWKPAGLVTPTDRLLDGRLRQKAAGLPRTIEEAIGVYDLTLDAPHCFFAGGLLVHNKDRSYWPKVDDPWFNLWMEPMAEKPK